MPLLKNEKLQRGKEYAQRVASCVNAVAFSHAWVSVNTFNILRKEVDWQQWTIEIVKKRVLLKWLPSSDILTTKTLTWSVAVLYSYNESDQYAPLKTMNNLLKQRKKEKLPLTIEYLVWYLDKDWKDWNYVTMIADLPSKEELVSKLLFLLQYPVSSLARTLKAIADK